MVSEKKRTCILCGEKEEMASYICSTCQERIQREAAGRKERIAKDARKELKKYGIVPEVPDTE